MRRYWCSTRKLSTLSAMSATRKTFYSRSASGIPGENMGVNIQFLLIMVNLGGQIASCISFMDSANLCFDDYWFYYYCYSEKLMLGVEVKKVLVRLCFLWPIIDP